MEKLPCLPCCGAGRIVFCWNERLPHVSAALVEGGLAHVFGMLALGAGGLPQGFEVRFVGCMPMPLLVGEEGFSVAKLLMIWSGVMAREAGPPCGLSTELIEEVTPVGHVGELGFVGCTRCDGGTLPVALPSTRRSKSSSPTPEEPNGSLDGMLMRSFERGLSNPFVEFEASSLSFLVCSCSILEDKLLMRVMYS